MARFLGLASPYDPTMIPWILPLLTHHSAISMDVCSRLTIMNHHLLSFTIVIPSFSIIYNRYTTVHWRPTPPLCETLGKARVSRHCQNATTSTTKAQGDGEMLIVQENEGLGVVLAPVGRVPSATPPRRWTLGQDDAQTPKHMAVRWVYIHNHI